MKKVFALGLLAMAGSLSALALPRSRQAAMTLAIEHAKNQGITLNSNTLRRCIVGKNTSEQAAYYVFNHGNKQGWTIVSGDDRTDDILGYATEGTFDATTLPTPVVEMLEAHQRYVSQLDETKASELPQPMRVARRAASATDAIGPFLATRWDQYKPYYNQTPMSGSTHCATGCVATAFSQILYYLYHTQGQQESTTFSNNLPSYTGSTGYVTGNPVTGPRTYEWGKMVADYNEGYTDEQAEAVAKLLSDVGVAVQMKYATSTSITNSKFVSQSCADYFGLQQGSSYIYDSNMGAATWQKAVKNELGNYRPVLIASNDHAYICDGYDGNGLYHINFGYSGRGDGWYTLSAMNGYGANKWGYTTGLKLRESDTVLLRLDDICKTARAQAALVPVGTAPNQYRSDLYEALMKLVEAGEAALTIECDQPSEAEITALCNEISQAIVALTTQRVPFLTGTYYVKTYTNYSDGKVKAMYAKNNNVSWGTINTSDNNYKWYLEYDAETNAYKMYNVGSNAHFASISTSTQAKLSTTSTTEVEIRPLARITRGDEETYACTIRPMVSGYNTGHNYYCHQNTHSNGSGTGGTVVGWEPYSDANQWYFEAIDVNPEPTSSFEQESLILEIGQTAINKLTTNSTGRVSYASSNNAIVSVAPNGQVTAKDAGTATITATIAKTEEYSSQRLSYKVVVPEDKAIRGQLDALIATAQGLYTDEQLAEARTACTDVKGEALFKNASQFTSPYTETSEGKISYLLDGNASTFWHSKWSGGNVAAGTHYFVMDLDEAITSDVLLSMTRRSSATNDHPTQFKVYSSTNGSDFGSEAVTIDLPYETAGETVTTIFRPSDNCKAMKFVCTATTSSRGYFHMGEFQLYLYQRANPNEAQLALVQLGDAVAQALGTSIASQQAIDNLQQAIDAYQTATVGIKSIVAPATSARKVMRQGRIVIERGGSQYTTTGIRL